MSLVARGEIDEGRMMIRRQVVRYSNRRNNLREKISLALRIVVVFPSASRRGVEGPEGEG